MDIETLRKRKEIFDVIVDFHDEMSISAEEASVFTGQSEKTLA